MTKCANCNEHEGTNKWVGSGGMLAYVHGGYAMWCDCCCLKAQLKHAREMAAKIPELEAELKKACVTPRVERSE